MLNIDNKTKVAILKKFDDVCLDGVLTELNWWRVIVQNIKREPSHSVHVANGVSKCVFLFDDFPDIVVKIPFTGAGFEDEDNEDEDEEEHDLYEDYSGASMCCGNHRLERDWDYCEAEEQIYQDAALAGVSDFFAETACIGMIDNHPIYVQERASVYYDHYKSYQALYTSCQITKICLRIASKSGGSLTFEDCWTVNRIWLAEFAKVWGDQAAVKLLNFLKIEEVEDLHSENLGFIGGKPVIIDYSSFNS